MSRVPLDTTIRNEAGRLVSGLDLYALTRGDPTRADAVDGSDPVEVAAFVGGETEIDVYAARTGGSPLTQPLSSYSEDSDFYWVDPASVDKYVPADEKNPITPVECAKAFSIPAAGTLANRPAAATAGDGALYYATDAHLLYRSNGSAWSVIGGDGILGQSAAAVSHTGNTTETALATITVPANAMGANGRIRVTATWTVTNSANLKTLRHRFGGLAGTVIGTSGLTASASARNQSEVANRNATNSQVAFAGGTGGFGAATTAVATAAIDTTAATTIVLTGQLASAGETITLESYLVELFV